MERIIMHWTAGQNTPNADEFQHYHFLYGNGLKFNGFYKPEDNINCNDGKYAAHTGGLNTGSIGMALCGMLDFNSETKETKYPIKKIDVENMCYDAAKLCKKYNIPITSKFIKTHFEVRQDVINGFIKRTKLTAANTGKIDIIYLHCFPKLTAFQIGNFLRVKIKVYYDRLQK